MTDQTVPVSVDLLKALQEVYPTTIANGRYPVADLAALIPTPPKVGDVLTEGQIKALPPRAVLRDGDDDLWVIANEGKVHLITFKWDGSLADDDQEAFDAAEYSPVLVSLPSGSRD